MYPNQHNQSMVQMHPSELFQQPQTYPTQQFVANQKPKAKTQNPNGPFVPMVRLSAKFCDVCGKLNHTAKVNAGGDRNYKDAVKTFRFQTSQKTNKTTESAP